MYHIQCMYRYRLHIYTHISSESVLAFCILRSLQFNVKNIRPPSPSPSLQPLTIYSIYIKTCYNLFNNIYTVLLNFFRITILIMPNYVKFVFLSDKMVKLTFKATKKNYLKKKQFTNCDCLALSALSMTEICVLTRYFCLFVLLIFFFVVREVI